MTSRWIRSAPAFWTRWTAYCRFDRSESRMLAATRARPSATLLPHPGRRGLVAPFTVQGRRALRDESGATTGDRRGRWLARALRGELATRRANLLATVPANRRLDPGGPQRRGEGLDDRHRARGPRRVGHGVHRDEVHVRVVAAQEVDHRLGVELGVVDAADHRDLVADPATGRGGVVAGRGDDIGDRPAPVQRD